jgi:hypothetical protein
MNALLDSIATLWLQNDSNLNCHLGTRLKAAISIVILEQGRKPQSQLSSWNKAESRSDRIHEMNIN